MKLHPRRFFAVMAVLAVAAFAQGAIGTADDQPAGSELPLHMTATAVDMTSGAGAAGVQTLEITIERWSTPAERQKLVDTLKEKGPEALLSTVQSIEPRAGYIRTSWSLGWDVQFAYEKPSDGGGRRIVIATDRPMSFWEASTRPRSSDYGFMLAEIRLGPDDTGEGKLAPAAKVTYFQPTRTIEIENYDIEPVRLQNVRVRDGAHAEDRH